MRSAYTRLFERADLCGQAQRQHLELGAHEDLGRTAALGVARANGAQNVEVAFPDGDTFAPVRLRVTLGVRASIGTRSARTPAAARVG